MVGLIDYGCPACTDHPNYRNNCSQCGGSGGVRLPSTTVPYRDEKVELLHNENKPIEDGPFARVDVIHEDSIRVNGTVIDLPADVNQIARVVQQVLEAADCPFEIETFSEYEATDCLDYLEGEHYDDS